MTKKVKILLLALCVSAGVSSFAYGWWSNAETIVYFSDSSMTQVVGYKLFYCSPGTGNRKLVGEETSYIQYWDGGSCPSGIPPIPNF